MTRLMEFAKGSRKVIPLAGFPGADLSNTSIRTNLFNPQVQAHSLEMLVEQTSPDAIFTMMDLSVEAGALGLPIRYPLNESPSVENHPVKTRDDLKKLELADAMDDCRIWAQIQTVSRLKRRVKIPVGAYVAGPYTLAGLLIGASDIAIASIEEPEFVKFTIELCENIIKRYSKLLQDAGANFICILEPTAMMLSPQMFWEYSGVFTKNIIDSLDCPSILHICGNTTHLIEKMCNTGADGLSLDSDVCMKSVISRMPHDCVLIGNINPVATVQQGSTELVTRETTCLLELMQEHANFIMSTGCDLPPGTPIENISAMVQATRRFKSCDSKCTCCQ